MLTELKTVDFLDPQAAQKFTNSLRDTGFAVIKNHPISFSLIENTFAEWNLFFSKNDAYKKNYLFDKKKQSGFFPYKSENAKDSNLKDLKEFYHFFPWSTLPPEANKYTEEFFQKLNELGLKLLDWIYMNTPPEIKNQYSMPLSKMAENSADTLLRPIHYPPISEDIEPGAVRAAAHEDINLITLLPAATEPGLQVLDINGIWHDVPCDRGTIVINSGDMLKMASGEYFPSTTHRVVNPLGSDSKKARMSMPLFVHPRNEVQLSDTHTAGSYLDERLKEIGLK